MLPEPNDFDDLITKTNSGDLDARERLFEIVQHELHRIASRLIRPGRERFEVEHDMLVDDAFMRLTRRESHWNSVSEFYRAAFVTMWHLLKDNRRRVLKQKDVERRAALPLDAEDPGRFGVEDPGRVGVEDPGRGLADIEAAIDYLWATNADFAEIFELSYLFHLSVSEIADTLQLPRSAVHYRRHRALRLLRDLLQSPKSQGQLQRMALVFGQARIELTIDKDFDSFSYDDESGLLASLHYVLDYPLPIRVITRLPGSTRIIIALPARQAEQLLWLYERGVLNELGVRQAKIVRDAVTAGLMSERKQRKDFDVLMCHNSDDKPEIKRIALKLRARDVIPWLDIWELQPGRPWQDSLEAQIASIKSAAVFVGNSGVGPWQDMELRAFIREFVSRRCPVIPSILRTCSKVPVLPSFLSGMTWVDFRNRSPNPYDQLVWGITGNRPQ